MVRLGFHYHVPAKELDGKIFMPAYFGRFIDSLAPYCQKLICFLHTPRRDEEQTMDYLIINSNVELITLGPHSSVPKRLLSSFKVKKIVEEWLPQMDCMLIRGSSPLLPVIADACKGIPISLLIVNDYLAGINDLPQPKWRKELIKVFAVWNTKAQERIAKKSLIFVNSQKLYQDLLPLIPNLILTKTSSITAEDIFIREDTCNNKPIKFLYTGRIDRTKGLLNILQALILIDKSDIDLVWNLVGSVEKNDPILEELFQLAKTNNFSEKIIYHGYKTTGPELFQYYQKADIFVTATTNSEGFPRTIWEAMANSLPVIATKVGAIPDFIEGSAELVEPHDVNALVVAIKNLINSSELRKKYIRNGVMLAKANTLDFRAKELMCFIAEWVDKK